MPSIRVNLRIGSVPNEQRGTSRQLAARMKASKINRESLLFIRLL